MKSGSYTVVVFDTYGGSILSTQQVQCVDESLNVPYPSFTKNVALAVFANADAALWGRFDSS